MALFIHQTQRLKAGNDFGMVPDFVEFVFTYRFSRLKILPVKVQTNGLNTIYAFTVILIQLHLMERVSGGLIIHFLAFLEIWIFCDPVSHNVSDLFSRETLCPMRESSG
jgi:hypothetical protein